MPITLSLSARRATWALALASALAAIPLAGCDRHSPVSPVANQRPTIFLTASPLPSDSVSYVVTLRWFATDADGEVTRVSYAVDPPADGDTAWVSTGLHEATIPFQSENPQGSTAASPHVFVIKAWDNEGLPSEPVFRAFTSTTVAPQSRIESPKPNPGGVLLTLGTLTIEWSGLDPDGITTGKPIGYRYRIASIQEIRSALGITYATPSAADVQAFFGRDAPDFESWERASVDSTYRAYENLTTGMQQYFAVVSFDEAGAYESRFILGANVLRFQPVSTLPLPRLSVWNSFFAYSQPSGGFNLDERFVIRIDYISDVALPFQWSAEPWTGTELAGYRWVVDPPNGDIFDETPRELESQTWRWSAWSVDETQATIGPFPAGTGPEPPTHRLYIEARDNASRMSIVTIEIRILSVTRDRPLLVFDDFRAPGDRIVGGDPDHPQSYQPYDQFPTEAVLDTLLFAVGGKPYQRRPAGTLSQPGMFAGFDYDTLDYRFSGPDGVPLEVLMRYEAVVIFTGFSDANRSDTKTSGGVPMSAVRYTCQPGLVNTLALYVERGGQLWFFGHGSLLAMIRGGIGAGAYPPLTPPPGTFLYESLKARSRLAHSGGGTANLVGATPYLPEFVTPGRPWPLVGWTGGRGPHDDPRIGPSSERNRERWEGLPQLSLTKEFPTWPYPLPDQIAVVPWVSTPNEIVEDLDPGPGFDLRSTLDTLYLYRALQYSALSGQSIADGKPLMLAYHGQDHGMIVWTSLPYWFIDREQLRQLAAVVLRNLGQTPQANPAAWTGPGTAHRFLPPELAP